MFSQGENHHDGHRSGPISANSMGLTLIHEHILVDFIGAESTGYHRWNRETVVEKVFTYLLEAKDLGVKTILECTPAYLGRDPILMKMLSKKSRLNIVTNTGYLHRVLISHDAGWYDPGEDSL